MSRVLKGFKGLLASSSSAAASSPWSSSIAAAKFSSSASAAAKATAPKAAKATKKAATPSKPKAEKPATPPRATGILKVTPVTPALAQFLGVHEASRTDAVKQIWTYIKSNNLQNPSNKREIFCDEKLKSIFDGKEKVSFLEIGKLLSRHFAKAA